MVKRQPALHCGSNGRSIPRVLVDLTGDEQLDNRGQGSSPDNPIDLTLWLNEIEECSPKLYMYCLFSRLRLPGRVPGVTWNWVLTLAKGHAVVLDAILMKERFDLVVDPKILVLFLDGGHFPWWFGG
ncbi:hypothetical protein N658DRAFT_569636, partial [Parathielavia hyrcaniae]